MLTKERTARDWFNEEERCYVENHQGCAWCGGAHRVYRTPAGSKLVYYCISCDFQVSYDREAGRYFSVPGVADNGDKSTMLDI